jgi:MFS family permease
MAAIADVRAAGGLQGYFRAHRTLEVYPTGAYRWGLLVLTLAASMLAGFDLNYSALLPLWMASLHFTAKEFGYFLSIGVVLSGISTMIGGSLADRYGRVVVIYLCLACTVTLTFCNLLMTGFWSFVLVRALMTTVAGMTIPAIHGLTRDLSPRLARGAAYGLLAAGAGVASLVWTFVPGITLPHFPTWEAQIRIMGTIGLLLYAAILLGLKDLSPSLRLTIIESEASAKVASQTGHAKAQVPGRVGAGFRLLLSRWQIWVLVFGGVPIMTVNLTMQTFGPLIYVQALKYTAAQASRVASYYFLTHTLGYFVGGWLSDRLHTRKLLGIAMAVGMMVLLSWWALTFSHPFSFSAMIIFNLALGALAAAAYTPFVAFLSEYLEDISPAVQATGWGIFFSWFRVWFALVGIAQPHVAQRFGWQGWIWVVVGTGLIYTIALLLIRGRWWLGSPVTSLRPVQEPAAG